MRAWRCRMVKEPNSLLWTKRIRLIRARQGNERHDIRWIRLSKDTWDGSWIVLNIVHAHQVSEAQLERVQPHPATVRCHKVCQHFNIHHIRSCVRTTSRNRLITSSVVAVWRSESVSDKGNRKRWTHCFVFGHSSCARISIRRCTKNSEKWL